MKKVIEVFRAESACAVFTPSSLAAGNKRHSQSNKQRVSSEGTNEPNQIVPSNLMTQMKQKQMSVETN